MTYYLIKKWLGLNTHAPSMQLVPGEASASENVRSKTGFELMKRKGYVNLNSTAITDSWTTKTSMLVAQSVATGYSLLDFFHVIGGNTNDGNYNQQYNIFFNIWSYKTALSIRCGSAFDFVLNSVLAYNVGGTNTQGAPDTNANLEYSLLSNSFTTKTVLTAIRSAGASTSISNLGYVAGGIDVAQDFKDTVYQYTRTSNAWATKTSLSTSRSDAEGFSLNGSGYVIGGLNPTATGLNEKYTVSSDTWSTKTALSTARYGASGMAVGSFAYMCGGNTGSIVATVNRYDIGLDTWSVKTAMGEARFNLQSGSFNSVGFTAGGTGVGSDVNTVEMYNPPMINGLYDFQQSLNSKNFTILGTPKQLLYWTGSAFSSLGSSFTGTYLNPWSFSTYNDVLYSTNGSDTMQKWDGVTSATVTVQGNIYETRSPVTAMTARSGVAAFSLQNSGFVCGGTTGSVSQLTERYDDLPNTFTSRTSMAGAARQLLAAFSHSGFGYVAGGSTGSVSAVTEQFSEVTNVWKTTANLNTARSGLAGSVSTLYGYVSGGTTGSVSAVHEQYDPVLNTWAAKTAMTTARQDLSAGTVTDPHVFGGSTGADSAVNERYSESGNSWTTRSAMNTARDLLGSFLATEGITEDIYSCGGHVAAVSAVTERYRYAVDIWISRGAMTTARSSLAGFTIGNKGYAAGGTTGSVSAVLEKYFAGATPPKFKYLMVHKGYGFGCGSADYPSRDFWSALGDLDNWDPINFEDIASDDGDVTTGQFEHNGVRHVTKQDRIYQTVFSDDPADKQIIPLTPGIGCVSNASIVKANEGRTYFRGERGFYEYGDSIRLISDPIEDTFFALNQNLSALCAGCDNKRYGEVWWAVASANATGNDEILAYSYRMSTPDHPVWWRYTSINASAMGEVEDPTTDLPTLYHGDYAGKVYYHDESVDNDDGTAITSSWTSGDMALHQNEVDPVILSRMLAWIESTTAAGNLTGDVYYDYSSTATDSPSFSLSATGRVDKNLSKGTPHTVKVKLSHSTAAQSWQVNKLALGVEALEEDRVAL